MTSNLHSGIVPRAASRRAWSRVFDRLARRVLRNQLSRLREGELILDDGTGIERFGDGDVLSAAVRVHDSRFFRQAVCGGTLSVAESYLRGDWDCDDLTALFRIFVRNRPVTDRLDSACTEVIRVWQRLWHWRHANTRPGSKRNIAAHYDLGNAFYGLWLDETMAYSSGIFPHAHVSLAEASREKFDRICRLLELQPADELLEIGTGWGGFALHAAENYGCRVTTTTISHEQYDCAARRIESAGLCDRISLLQQDYRDLQGKFDKLASIEMIEAVGHRFLPTFFRKCSELLRPDGSLVLQAIVMPERGYKRYLKSVDFIQRYVFPGGCLPSLAAMLSAAGRTTDLRFVRAEDYAAHYAETLRQWRRAFEQRSDEVRRLGLPEAFVRLWKYYLCYCEAAFEERAIGLLQLRFDKPAAHRRNIAFRTSGCEKYAVVDAALAAQSQPLSSTFC